MAIDVVSVQSQVVYGRVGNSAALPTLEALGLLAAPVPTVVLSHVPEYGKPHGGAIPIDWFEGYLDDLSARGALESLRVVLTGYLGSPEQARVLARWIRRLLDDRPTLRVVVDPVIGDHEYGVYVDAGLVDAYRHDLLALADGLTPNDFELAQLTGLATGDIAGTVAAARKLLAGRTQWVVATSAARNTWAPGQMKLVLVTRSNAFVVAHPAIDVSPKGTGDLFAASLTACWLDGDAPPLAVAKACRRVLRALALTRDACCAELLLPLAGSDTQDAGEIDIQELAPDFAVARPPSSRSMRGIPDG